MVINGIEVKEIPGFPSYYISKAGVVWSKPKHCGPNPSGKWIKPGKNKGYLRYMLNTESCRKGVYAHRAVLETWVGPCPKGMECCHNNGIPYDNRLENLRWDTKSNNQLDSIMHGTLAGLQPHFSTRKLTKQQVKDIRVYSKILTKSHLSKIYEISRTAIRNMLNGKTYKEVI